MTSPHQVPTLIIVNGLPATGKTTLAQHIRHELGWPLIAKDALKESLASAFPAGTTFDRNTSHLTGRQAIGLLFELSRELIESGVSCVVEANFLPDLAKRDFAPFQPIAQVRQVHCTVPAEMVLERYQRRSAEGGRHPIHVDEEALDEMEERIASGAGNPIPLDAPLLEVSTIEGYDPSVSDIVAFCRS